MTAEANIQKAEAEIKNKNFEEALECAKKAIALDPTKFKPYLQKSIADQRLKNYQESFDASEIAIANAFNMGRREAIGDGQFRRGIAAYYLKRFADSDHSFDLAKEYGCKDRSLEIWKSKLEDKLENDTVAIEDIPKERAITEKPKAAVRKEIEEEDADTKAALEEKNQQKLAQKKPTVVPYDANKVRNDWFQTSSSLDVSLFLKNAPKDKTTVDFASPNRVVVKTVQPTDGSPFEYTLELANNIDPEKSSFRVFGTKIELNLVKAETLSWTQLEATTNSTTGTATESSEDSKGSSKSVTLDEMRAALNEPKLPPVNGPKNWDKLASAELDELEKGEEKDSDPNDFFKKLFADADEDTRRAMMKSYVESNGTALSTDWSEVKDKKYPVDPPTGMEAKRY